MCDKKWNKSLFQKFQFYLLCILVPKNISPFCNQKYFITLVLKIFHHFCTIYFITLVQKYFLFFQKYFFTLVPKLFHYFDLKNSSSLCSQKYFITLVPKIFHHFGSKTILSFCSPKFSSFWFQRYFIIFENISTSKQEMELFGPSSEIATDQ